MTTPPLELTCPKCNATTSASSRFCSQCGWDLSRPVRTTSFRGQDIVKLGVVALAIWFAGWQTQEYLGGKKPTAAFEKAAPVAGAGTEAAGHAALPINDPELEKLRTAAEAAPTDKSLWTAYANSLAQKISLSDKPSPELIFEAIGALRKILDIDPKDPDALLAMAEISFNQQAFSKAAEFYSSYLSGKPEDLDVRARYGSTLTFLGKFDQSIAELKTVLTSQPGHFHALAYTAVTYAELGRKDDALMYGELALKRAPSDEARARFSEFLNSIRNGPLPERTSVPSAQRGDSASLPPEANAIVAAMRANPVAGPKFAGAEMRDASTLVLSFNEFPMEQMPPFVREKFTKSVTEKLTPDGALKSVIFYDAVAKKELQKVERP